MRRLLNGVQHYDWGSADAIPRFLGEPPPGPPVAEMWIGTHPIQPSRLEDDERLLSDLAGDLPFMVKLLAAERPLSLQVHPTAAQARLGFEREEAAGVPLDAPERTFKDPHAKPEMVYALSTFDSLVGFRPTAEILRVLAPIGTELGRRVAADLRHDPGWAGIVRRIEWLLTSGVSDDEVLETVTACRQLAESGLDVKRAYATAVQIAEHHPTDVGVIVSLMLNRLTLQPGEAAYLDTGVIHAHLSGLCLEVMASSDNVLRAGLTAKHVDVPGLIDSLGTGMARVARVTPEMRGVDTEVFAPANTDFALAVTQVSLADPDGVPLARSGASVVVCTGGEVALYNAADEKVILGRGESAYVEPGDRAPLLVGLGEVAQVYVPSERTVRSRMVDVV